MSWHESSRDVHGDLTYVTYRCSWCRKYAVATGVNKPSRCSCAATAKEKR